MEIGRLFKAGNSLVVAIPRKMRNYLAWRLGDKIIIELGADSNIKLKKIVDVLSNMKKEQEAGKNGKT